MPKDTCSCLTGINEKTSIIRHKTTAVVSSHYAPFKKTMEFSVMNKITGNLPTQIVDIKKLALPAGKILSDPKFYEPSKIDMLLNAEVFYDCLLGEKFRLPEGPMMVHTKFGWILGGEIRDCQTSQSFLSCFSRSHSSFSTSEDIN